ncbi:MAG: halocyanin domain-containing protein [Haloarculaceae archaeon]
MKGQIGRRDVLRGIGVAAMAGALAGCSTETQSGGDGGDDGGDGGGDGGGSDGGDGGSGDLPSDVSEYLSDANLYDGSIADVTDSDSVTVMVGAGDQGYAFDPAAIRVSTGTTVTWEWTGAGGGHNVVANDDTFSSGDEYVSEAGYTYEYTFESSGTHAYHCVPHEALGMKGAVVVE